VFDYNTQIPTYEALKQVIEAEEQAQTPAAPAEKLELDIDNLPPERHSA